MMLFELFNQAVPFEKSDIPNRYEFYINDVHYQVGFSTFIPINAFEHPKRVDEVIFKVMNVPGDMFGDTGTGNQFKVFATVLNIIKEHSDKLKTDHLTFSAENDRRANLYKRMLKYFNVDYTIDTTSLGDNKVLFIMPIEQFRR